MALDPRLLEYFHLFNAASYYEAHEVLEDLWHTVRPSGENATFFKGMIQLAGAFTHLKLHHDFREHHVHCRRLRPAAKLFALSAANLTPYTPRNLGIDVNAVLSLIASYAQTLIAGGLRVNPWTPAQRPQLAMPDEPRSL